MEQDLVKYALETNFTGGMPHDFNGLKEFLEHPDFPDRAEQFKTQLTDAITLSTISPAMFEEITSLDMDSQEDVDKFLVENLWQVLYNEPAPSKPTTN